MKALSIRRAMTAICSIMLAFVMLPSNANVVISGTRVVYPAKEREVTIKLDNAGKEPALVQVWVDCGNPKSLPDTADAPFLLTPPIVRIAAGGAQTLRMTYTHDALPQDVESVFWLNVLDVPPLPKAAESNFVQLAYRSRIKVFYRPVNLRGFPEDAPAAVTWTWVRTDQGIALRGHNPTSFNVSYNKTTLTLAGKSYSSKGGMIGPGASEDFILDGLDSTPAKAASVRYEWINDYGAAVIADTRLAN
ncbi:molecular chaperone EcpD [Pseudomonas fluorescens HK44]|uniref:Molecular chaperone EcpD n=1 Tax=Pseudomonas fluorescens HK44 TaxID=1042209 RepID=A0A010TEI3_PSEFL|nr:fimbria/pilus periplasmic chaperone [Pseudomonas fluorescens]EXF95617.1 molecular chaperone EcpD [Pseudomonas fluorescens HK44]